MSRRWACGVAGEFNSTYRSLPLFVAVEAKLKRQTVCVCGLQAFFESKERTVSIRAPFELYSNLVRLGAGFLNRRIVALQITNSAIKLK